MLYLQHQYLFLRNLQACNAHLFSLYIRKVHKIFLFLILVILLIHYFYRLALIYLGINGIRFRGSDRTVNLLL